MDNSSYFSFIAEILIEPIGVEEEDNETTEPHSTLALILFILKEKRVSLVVFTFCVLSFIFLSLSGKFLRAQFSSFFTFGFNICRNFFSMILTKEILRNISYLGIHRY